MRHALLLLGGVAALGMLAVVVHAQAASIAVQAARDPYSGLIAEAAQRFGISAAWIRAIIRVESRGDPRAVSPKGAMGLMQLMPETWAALRVRYGLGRDPFNPQDNILAGAAYLREMYDRYGSPGFLAAYNAGPTRYEDYLARRASLPSETVAYVAQLLPLLGSHDTVAPTFATAPDPLAWRRAPIFVVRLDRTQSALRALPEWSLIGAPTAIAMRNLPVRIPIEAGQVFRGEAGHRSDLKPAGIPISFRPPG